MIGQHLILRCAKGVYDHANAAGLKTAAVSEVIGSLSSARQQELNKVISEHAAFPDAAVKSGAAENRGVLRMFEYRGVLMAMRTFRVTDLCDNRGTVSFTHTYMIADDDKGQDRRYLLAHPESLCMLSCFDNYQKVAERTDGGLNSGNPVTVEDSLKMPDKELPKFDDTIFEQCFIDEETFARIVSAICIRVSSKGWVALMTPNITEDSWNEHGGSPDGEKLIAALLALLPDCITRFFSAVSYWNDNPKNELLNDYKFRILSGKYTDGLTEGEISLFDLQHGIINTDAQAGSFGRYLWQIKDDAEAIEKFHNFMTVAFGKNVDKIAKLPAIMDALTELYKFTEGETIDEQGALAAFLLSIGTSIPMFPAIYKGVAMLIFSIRESGEPCSDKLESVIMTLLKNPDTKKLKVCYENMITLLMHSVDVGTAKEKTVAMIAEKLDDRDVDEYRDQFTKYLEQMKNDPETKPSYSMISLLLDAEDIPMLRQQREDITAIIDKCYGNALAAQDFELCTRMTTKQLRKEAPPDNVMDICKRVVELTDYCSPETAAELVVAIGEQMDRFEQYDDTIVSMGKAIFGLETECDIAAYPDFFPLFMKVLRHGLIADREYIETVWIEQYIFVIQNTNGEEYLFPEMYLGDPTLEGYADSLYIIEVARIRANVGYKSTWEVIEAIVAPQMETDPQKAYEHIQDIIDMNDEENRMQLLSEIIGTIRMYGLFLALYAPDSDKSNYLLEYIMQDMNAFDMLIAAAESEGFVRKLPMAYVYVWTSVYSAFADQMIENCWIGILDTESKIIEKPYCDEIMSQFAEYFTIVFEDITRVPEVKEEYIALLYRGIIDYGWALPLKLTEPQSDIVEMCYLIDNGGTEETVDYFIERIGQLVSAGTGYVPATAENLLYCTKRINRYLNNNRRKIMDGHATIDHERITILALARMYAQKHDESHSLFYLKSICEGDDHWIASLYVLMGLKYVYVFEHDESAVVEDFLNTLWKLILNASGAGRNTLLSVECQDTYHSFIQPHLYQDQQKKLHKAASGTGNPDLMAMFEINVTKERQKGSGGLFGRFKK